MKGDKILVTEHHKRAASQLAELLLPKIREGPGHHVVTIAGESGAGKSECAVALREALDGQGISGMILQQDDYFIYPPKTNDRMRRADIGWVGPSEVRLSFLDEQLADIKQGRLLISKPLVDYDADYIGEEEIDFTDCQVIIVEGTYTTLLDHADTHVFIDRTRHDTQAARLNRAREVQDDFLERVLEIEHEIIATHKRRADIIVNRGYNVVPAGRQQG